VSDVPFCLTLNPAHWRKTHFRCRSAVFGFDREDPHRMVDFRGGPLMATGSADRVARLLHVASETTAVAALSGHSGSIRAVLLCEDRGLLITAGCDGSIR